MPYTVTLNTTDNYETIRKIADAAFLLLAGLYVFVVDISKTTLRVGIPDHWERYHILALSASVILRLAVLYLQDAGRRGSWLRYLALALTADFVYFLIYHAHHNKTLVFLAVLTLGMIGIDYIKVLKVYAAAASVVIFPVIALAWSGAIQNFVYVRDMTIRSSWGIKYPTDMMSLMFFLCLALWITAKKRSNLWFIIPGAVMLAMSVVVADSRTGAMCDLALILVIVLNYYLSKKEPGVLNRIVKICACAAFPVFTVLMNGLMLAYRAGNPFAVKINGLMSNRLMLAANALNDYGISLFGKPLPQVGNGGSAFARPDYYFVDISYNLILLQFGVVAIILVNILWVMMTRKAFKIGDRRLALALALVAFNAVSEHHITQINYDIFIVMPFAILTAQDSSVCEGAAEPALERSRLKEYITKAAVIIAVTVLSVAAVLGLLPKVRTVFSLIGTEESTNGRRLLYVIYVLGIAAAAAAVIAIYRLSCSLLLKDEANRKTLAYIIAGFAAAGCVVLIGANSIVDRGASKNAALLDSEKRAVEIALESGEGKLYSNEMPELYEKAYRGLSSDLFDGEELARYNNVSVIMDKYTDSNCFFNTGFLYTPISDEHALFTNDRAVITALQNDGYHMTGYYPVKTDVDMQNEAELNDLSLQGDGSIVLTNENEMLRKGPRANLTAGRYTMTYDLSVDKNEMNGAADDEAVCTLRISYYRGQYTAAELPVTYGMFDRSGNYKAEIICTLPDAERTNIQIFPAGNSKVTVRGMSWQKTPERDTHSFYDENRVKYREEYFDLEGLPYEGTWGYFAKELGYDGRGNVNHEVYYDANGEKTLNSAGYSEIRKTFNDSNWNIREEYYGTDGKRIAQYSGQSATEYKYDAFGRLTETAYFDTEDKPVLMGRETWGGFHRVIYTLDNEGRIIREDFLGTDNKAIMLKEGFASHEYEYDDNGNRVREIVYNQDGERALNRTGYSEIRREFNSSNQIIRESYYGVDGRIMSLPPGQAMMEYNYDEKGRPVEITYYDSHNRPVTVGGETWGGYHKVTRVFDDKERIVREDFFGTDGKPVILKEGYSYREYEYDDNDNRIRETYYDQNGNNVLNAYGYAGLRREFDESNRVSRESFLDADGKLTEGKEGYASRVPEYDENNAVTGFRYYDINGNEVYR